jgi:hypothetical protein
MMKTDDLIAALSADPAPVPGGWLTRSIAIGALGGTLAAAVLWLGMMGPRPDLSQAAQAWPFWIKFFYTLALALAGLWLLARAGRPGAALAPSALTMLAPFVLLTLLAAIALAAPGADHRHLLMGHSALFCPFAIVAVSLPVLAGAFWSLKRLAPTRLALAGAAAGLFAGSAGAFVYAFYCTESAVPFVALWYSVGIVLSGMMGALLGRIALRW